MQNEIGDASHAKYKERQKKAVIRRLQLGGGDPASTGSSRMRAAPPVESIDPSDVRKRK
jgi:hypothetical protein